MPKTNHALVKSSSAPHCPQTRTASAQTCRTPMTAIG